MQYDEYGGVILSNKDKVLKQIGEIDDFVLPSAMIEDAKKTKKEKKAESKKEVEKEPESIKVELSSEDEEWLKVFDTICDDSKPKSKTKFKGWEKGKKKKNKKNKNAAKDFSKEFESELLLVKSLSRDQAEFVSSLQKTYNHMTSAKATSRGISKNQTDLINAISTARTTQLNMVKEIINIKKTSNDLDLKYKKEFGKNDAGGSDNAEYSSTFLSQLLGAGRKNIVTADTSALTMGTEDTYQQDIEIVNLDNSDNLLNGMISMSDDSPQDVYMKYSSHNIEQVVYPTEDGSYVLEAVDQDGNIIPNYPKRPGIKFTIESSMGVAIDQYGEKYRLME